MAVETSDLFGDVARWQAMLDADLGGGEAAGLRAGIGVLRQADFDAGCGELLLWQPEADGLRVRCRAYRGTPQADVALLLVAEEAALRTLRDEGMAGVPALVRAGRLRPFVLRTADQLEADGLADFVEDLGLVFPSH